MARKFKWQLTVSAGRSNVTRMTALWTVSIVALLAALAALASTRRTSRQLAQVTEMYWQLKFDHAELKAKVAPPAQIPPAPQQTFVPLTRLRSAAAPENVGASGEAGSTQER